MNMKTKMKAWGFGGRARPTQIRLHMSRSDFEMIEENLFEAFYANKTPENKALLERFRSAKKLIYKIKLDPK